MLSLKTQRSELQSEDVSSAEPRNFDIISQKSGDLRETDDTVCLSDPEQSFSASFVRSSERHCNNTITAKDAQKVDTWMIALPSNIRHYRRRLHGVRNSFEGWLNQPEVCEALPKSDVYDAAQPQRLNSDLPNTTSQIKLATEPSKPYYVLEPSTTTRKDMVHFNCRWLGCDSSFGDRPSLREHVLDRHLAKSNVVGSLPYICLWRGCNAASSPPFSLARFFIEHLDQKHGLRAVTQTDYADSKLTSESERVFSHSVSIPPVDDNEARDATHQVVRGTKTIPMGVLDHSASSSHIDCEGHHSNMIIASPKIHVSRHDTEISLCDSAFESQASLHAGTKTRPEQVQHRKDAYRAAKGWSKLSWENDHRLISTSGGHGIEEAEL